MGSARPCPVFSLILVTTRMSTRALFRCELFVQAHIPALHFRSKLTNLRLKDLGPIVVDFWDLISAPALMELDIECVDVEFTHYCQTAPPAAVAALERGILHAVFKVAASDDLIGSELEVMESCGMEVETYGSGTDIVLERVSSMPAAIDAMWESGNLPFLSERLSTNAQRSTDDSYVEHALQQQAWHAEFNWQQSCESDDPKQLEGSSILSVW